SAFSFACADVSVSPHRRLESALLSRRKSGSDRMSIKVKCPGCTKTLTVPDAARGKAVKCPACETRVPIPADEAEPVAATKSAKSKKPSKKAAPIEDESGFGQLDLRKVEDREADVCPKCGYDLSLVHEEDEDVTECPQCGWDVAAGGLGEKAKKR